jgi:hypothetical protein
VYSLSIATVSQQSLTDNQRRARSSCEEFEGMNSLLYFFSLEVRIIFYLFGLLQI